MGRRIWVVVDLSEIEPFAYNCRVLSFARFLPADPTGPSQRKKHLVQIWTDPGGKRTLTIGSIRLKDPGKVAAGLAAAAARDAAGVPD